MPCYLGQIPPTSSQVATIDRYAHRVREFTISDPSSVRFLQSTSMRPSCLFPGLMVLQWNPDPFDSHTPSIIFIQRLLSPTLVSLKAALAEADSATLLSFLDNYPQHQKDQKVNVGFFRTYRRTIHALRTISLRKHG